MRCPICKVLCLNPFGLSVHTAEAHPVRTPLPFASTPRVLREFEPHTEDPKHAPWWRGNGRFPGVDIDAIHRNPKYAPPKR